MSAHLKSQLYRAVRLFLAAFVPALVAYVSGGSALTVGGVAAVGVSAVEVVVRQVRPTAPVSK